METIVKAALKYGEIIWTTEHKPSRHHHIFNLLSEFCDDEAADADQGFITNLGRFVDRKEALEIAKRARQLTKPSLHKDELFSEDLW